jgi:phospholipid transport system substrate-binding protein
MSQVRRGVAVLVMTLGVVAASPAWAGPPSDALEGYVARILAVMDDPRLKAPDAAVERQKSVRAVAEEVLDFRESARRSLGSHWEARTPAERTRFVRLFTDLIDQAYLSRLSLDGERIILDSETVDGAEATVKARALTRRGDATPVVFSLVRGADARWRVVDVAFEGMSLIGNYRAQFNKIIRASSYDALVARLESKTGGAAQASTGSEAKPDSP